MSSSSDVDFVTQFLTKHRRETRDGEAEQSRKRRKTGRQSAGEIKRKQGKRTQHEVKKPGLCSASDQERKDINFIVQTKREANIGESPHNKLREQGGGENESLEELEAQLEKIRDAERVEILGLLRDRRDYAKDDLAKYEDFETAVKEHRKAKANIREFLFVLGVKRSIGDNLPSVAELASHLFLGRKRASTTAFQKRVAGDMLIHVVRSKEVDRSRRNKLGEIQSTMLKLSTF